MIYATEPYKIYIPQLSLAPSSLYEYSGPIDFNRRSIRIPGLPPNRYKKIRVANNEYEVDYISGELIFLTVDTQRVGTYATSFNSGYAVDDGRNKLNWIVNKLNIKSIESGVVEFYEKFTVDRIYRLTNLNPIALVDGGVLPARSTFEFVCESNIEPTIFVGVKQEPGLIIIEFSDEIMQEGVLDGIDYDFVEVHENELHVYVSESGVYTISGSGFMDIYENPIDDFEVEVDVPVNVIDGEKWSIKYKNKFDYDDVVLSRVYDWMRRNGL